MKESNFRIVSMIVVLSLVLLVAVEVMWAVRTYRDMRESYRLQISSVLEEATWKYATPSMDGNVQINIGNIARFDVFVSEGLRNAGLATEYRVEVLSTSDDAPIVIMAMGEVAADGGVISVDKSLAPIILRLTVEDPHAEILGRMRWIIALQILAVVVLAATFVYLLRTLFRAKSLECIRRDLTHNITHELKTPVAAAYAATDMLLSDEKLADDGVRRGEYLRMTIAELEHLNSMIEEILRSSTEEYSRASMRMEECEVSEVVAEVVASIRLKYASRDVVWNVEVNEGVMVIADRFHLLGIVRALIDNAIKYSPTDAEVRISAVERGGETIIEVEDKGSGISRSEQRRIFDKFYRTPTGNRHDTKGYGLGLYYVKSIVKHHGGRVELRSVVGRGSCFTLHLPRYGK